MKRVVFMVFILVSNLVLGQEVKIKGGFLEDSLGIGTEIHYWLVASYPSQIELILPDSNYSYDPYDFLSLEYSNTTLVEKSAYDSVVYTLQSFDIDPVQYFQAKAIIIDQDSFEISSNIDSIYFQELVSVVSDTTLLKTNLSYAFVEQEFNYPLLWLILLALVVVLMVLALIFGRKIQRHFKVKRLKSDYNIFSTTISNAIRKLQEKPNPDIAENALIEWKKYLEKLEKHPYTKYTTKEILSFDSNQELKDTLKVIDRTVYGKVEQEEVFKSFQDIEDFTQHRYSMMLDHIKNGN